MRTDARSARVLIYSHDTFGLGHLRRCRRIAQSLVARRKGLSVLILSGSPIIGSFDFRTRVDFVRVPGVIKLRNGEYSSLSLHMDISEVMEMRASIIRHTAEVFSPDIFIVDKEPLGLRGEIQDTLVMLKERGTLLVLGLRDVMDDPDLLAMEWERKNPMPALRDLYDEILVYGLPQVCNPLEGIDLPESVRRKITYTGYLRSTPPRVAPQDSWEICNQGPFILVTPGGGGDGEQLINCVISAYENDADIPYPALLVFGPFMHPRRRRSFRRRAARLGRVKAITFDTHVEQLMDRASGVVAMGGYNTFCEILSFNKRALIVPRRRPRMEQYVRTSRAAELGLVRMLENGEHNTPQAMAIALRNLPTQPLPSDVVVPGLLEGLDNIQRLVDRWLDDEKSPRVALASRA
ncbi:MAG TPA: glycosyltransferase [Gammaproteobacteria bacterium]|nr:glycosyltransferase [Gammaproteobacteria bacterium]